jgi:hypothetical protein
LSSWRWDHSSWRFDEKGIAKEDSQPGEGIAGRRLCEANAVPSTCDTPLDHDRMEYMEQVEVHSGETYGLIHWINAYYHDISFANAPVQP